MSGPTTKILNPARIAVLEACEGWGYWTEKPAWIVKGDDDYKRFMQMEASVSRCPIITAFWNSFNPTWWVHSEQQWLAPLDVSVWVQEDRQTLAENMLEDAIDAVWRHPSSGSTAAMPLAHVRSVTGTNPAALLNVSIAPVQTGNDGKHRLLQATFTVQLRLRKDPLLRATA